MVSAGVLLEVEAGVVSGKTGDRCTRTQSATLAQKMLSRSSGLKKSERGAPTISLKLKGEEE